MVKLYDFGIIIFVTIAILSITWNVKRASHNRWEWEAGNMYLYAPEHLNCVDRVEILARKMSREGESYNIVHGIYKDEFHVWIEKNGIIIDPSIEVVEDWYYELYREER